MYGTVAVSDRSAEPRWDTTQRATRSAHYSTAADFVTWKGATRGIPVECRNLGDRRKFTAQTVAVSSTVAGGECLIVRLAVSSTVAGGECLTVRLVSSQTVH